MKGTIKKLVLDKPYGFISVEGQPGDIFFHKDKVVGVEFETLKEGDEVTFETETSMKNGEEMTNATNVQRAA